jgi:hypothetical protein
VRGRRCRNLFGATFDDALLARRVGEVRRELLLEREGAAGSARANARDVAAFAAWALVSAATYLVTVGVSLALPLAFVYALLRRAGGW